MPVKNNNQCSVDFTTAVYDNPEKTSHAIYTNPAQRLTTYYELMLFIILVSGIMFIIAFAWLKKKPKIKDEMSGAVKI